MTSKKEIDNSTITFFSGKKEFRSLSNFWEKDVIVTTHVSTHVNTDTREYESGEHCFHGEKYIRLGRLSEDLKKSKNKILIHPALRTSEEKVKSRIWEGKAIIKDGHIHILGKNRLGSIWMEVRSLY